MEEKEKKISKGEKKTNKLRQGKRKTDNRNNLILCVGVNVCLSVIRNYPNLQCALEHPHQRHTEVTPLSKFIHCTNIETHAPLASPSLSLCSITLNYLQIFPWMERRPNTHTHSNIHIHSK